MSYRFLLAASQYISIETILGRQQPVATMQLGTTRIIHSFKRMYHVVHLSDYQRAVESFNYSLNLLKKEENIDELTLVLEQKIQQLQQRLNSLLPTKRSKRGLVNGLGSMIKVLTGNMDATDEKEIQENLKILKQDAENLQTNSQNQLHFNNEILIRFKNITNHINKEQKNIENYIKQTQNSISKQSNDENKTIQILQYITRINANIDLTMLHLSNIAESLLLSKLKIVPKFILNNEEIDKIINIMQKQNLVINNEGNVYKILTLNAIMQDKDIIFTIKIPILTSDTYQLIRLIPLPINNTQFIVAPNYVASKNTQTLYFTEPCNRIDQVNICDLQQATFDTPNQECIKRILSNHTATCKVIETRRSGEIFEPQKGHIFVFNAPDLVVNSDCGEELIVPRSAILHYSNCSVTLDGRTFDNTLMSMEDVVNITVPDFPNIRTNLSRSNFNLDRLIMEDINTEFQIWNTQKLYGTHFKILYACLSMALLVGIVALVCTKRRTIFVPAVTPVIPERTIPSLWPSLQSRGGGVTTAPSPPPKPARSL